MKWEYRLVYLGMPSLDAVTALNAVGNEGWELVCIVDNVHGYFKRYAGRTEEELLLLRAMVGQADV